MKEEREDKSDSIKDGEVLQIANNILGLLDYSQQLDDEDILFSDEFYISILSNLLTEQNYEIKPGETPEEKVKSLKQLIKLLGQIIEMDLSQISAKGIILDHDKSSAKSLLELIEELIKTLINANLEEEEKNGNKSPNKKDESIELKDEKNNSENNIRKIRERMNLDDDNENEENNDDNENSSYKRKYAELEDGIDNIDDINDNFEEDEIKTEEKDNNKDKLEEINYDLKDDKNNESGSRVMNVSHISEMEKNKIQRSSGKKQEDNLENKTNKKKYDEIPDLLINKIKKEEKNENEEDDEEEGLKYNNYLESNSNMGESNIFDENENNYNVPQSVPRAYNKLHLSDASKESESSNNQYIRSKKKLNKEKEKDKKSSNTNSNISFHSKNKNKKNIDEYNDMNISSTNKKIEISSEIKNNYDNDNLKESRTTKSKIEVNNEENENEDDISKSSEYTNDVIKSSKSSSSKKSLKSSNKSKASSKNQQKISEKKSDKNNFNKNLIYFEIPISNEEVKYIIEKEIRKLYADKAPRYFSKEILELIYENLKLAKKEIIKYETGQESDDFFSREFFNKYQKQMQQVIKNVIREINQENIYKKNVIMSIGNNVNFMKKLTDVEYKDLLNNINNINNTKKENEMNDINRILMYPSYCYELQKKIYLTQTQNEMELNFAIEKERENNIKQTKDNYDDNTGKERQSTKSKIEVNEEENQDEDDISKSSEYSKEVIKSSKSSSSKKSIKSSNKSKAS